MSEHLSPVRWADLQTLDPDLATHVHERLGFAIVYFSTIRRDGWPRVHPVGVNFRDDRMVVVMQPDSPKAHDLRRTGRYAVHCTVEDSNGGGGEVLVTGRAVETETTPDDRRRGWIAFELLVGEVRCTKYDPSLGRAVSRRWRAPE